jgi:acetyl esterase/lipase
MPSIQSKLSAFFMERTIKPFLQPGLDIAALRPRMERFESYARFMDSGFTREDITVGGLSCQWIKTPGSYPDRILFYLHGGGFCFRSPHIHGQMLARLCKLTGTSGLMVDYRLAPEHPYPAAFEDSMAGYQWLLDEGYDPSQIAIGGDSAGGTLTLSILIHLRDQGLPLPACAILLSPALGLSSRDLFNNENIATDKLLSPSAIELFSQAYLPDQPTGHTGINLDDIDLQGLPPLFFQAGNAEILRDDSVVGAKKARQAGVEVELEVWEGMQHVFQISHRFVPEARQALESLAEFINFHLE